MELSDKKHKGKVYTPHYIVCNILDLIGYKGCNILRKNIIDNSCGDGAFLTEIVERYCNVAVSNNLPKEQIKADLETHIFGVELDEHECNTCVNNLEAVSKKYGIEDVNWNIKCGNTLYIDDYNNKMDFVVGNPPYVRIHNLDDIEKIKSFDFAKQGMTDLYIVFFEIGIRMLNKSGVLGYITPSSYFTSKSGKYMREYFIQNNLLTDVVDLKHNQVFTATTYTCITVLKRNNSENFVNYYEYDLKNKNYYLIEKITKDLFYINKCFYFAKKELLVKLKKILTYMPIFTKHHIEVKNGFATLLDSFFIRDEFDFSDYVIPVLKSSTGQWKKCFFPYNDKGQLLQYDTLKENAEINSYYLANMENLKKRDIEKDGQWWGFGRTQGIKDVSKIKYSINPLIRTVDDIKLIKVGANQGVYSGLYILTDLQFSILQNILLSDDFNEYISVLGKYKSGGYYTFSSKDVKLFLEYSLTKLDCG